MGKFIDLTGERFGKLEVISRAENNNQGKPMWNCRCDCDGKIIVVSASGLRNKKRGTKSCGCIKKEKGHNALKDLTGLRFFRLKVLGRAPNKGKNTYWYCECDCKDKTVFATHGGNLIRGHTKSCGCLSREHVIERNFRHGMSKERIYSIWCGIIDRCTNKNNQDYKCYGGRGISICNEWRNDFISFYDYVSKLPNFNVKGYSIDRFPNNNGNYEPGNVRWATAKEQYHNRRPRSEWKNFKAHNL